ncbi:MAG: AMP-binding protein [Acidobacteriota bacterium]
METLRSLVDRFAQNRPQDVYLVAPEPGLQLTFAQLQADSRALSGSLLAMGLNKGDPVAFMLDNGYQTAKIFLGALYGGFTVTPLNVQAQPPHLAYMLRQSGTRIVFFSPHYRKRLAKSLSQLPQPVSLFEVDVDSPENPLSPTHQIPELPALEEKDDGQLIYTSGTTGLPKGVVLTHGNLVAGGGNTAGAHQLTEADRALCVLPLYHINAQVVTLIAPLVSGGSVVLPHRFSVSRFWDLATDYKCTWLSVVPTIVCYLLDRTDPCGEGGEWKHLRFARSASAPLATVHHKSFEKKFKLPLIETMGLTETAAPILANPMPPDRRKAGSPGLPYGNEIKIVDRGGKELPAGRIGEVLVRGANVMKCYHQAPEITRQSLQPDGWLHTGDLAYRDPDGFFFITGKLGELIIKGGENIAPREVDEVLCRHPAVLEAAAVGISHQQYGEEVAACLILKSGACCIERGLDLYSHLSSCPMEEAERTCALALEIHEFCEQELGQHKSPAVIRSVKGLPRGPSGKLQRLKLRSFFQEPGNLAELIRQDPATEKNSEVEENHDTNVTQ